MAIGVIADDLTGALDSGLQLYRKGLSVSVFYSITDVDLNSEPAQIVVLDSESRNVPVEEAVNKIRSIIAHIKAHGIPVVYKKLDSTLRGNTGAEINAVLESTDFAAALVAPTLPKTGRTVNGGTMYVNSVPIAETEFSKDPLSPIESSVVADILSRDMLLACSHIKKYDLNACQDEIRRIVESENLENRQRVLIADAETDKDLERIAHCISASSYRLLPCGSAGLLEHLAGFVKQAANQKGSRYAKGPFSSLSRFLRGSRKAPVLIISSSMSEVTKRQIAHVVCKELVVLVQPAMEHILNADNNIAQYRRQIVQMLSEGKHVLVDTGGKREDMPDSRKLIAERSAALQRFLSKLAAGVLGAVPGSSIGGLVVTGGETAITVCTSLGACGIRMCGEIEQLVPAGKLIGGKFQSLPIVTKAGGFGTDQVFSKACRFLERFRVSENI